MDEYAQLTLEQLLIKALDSREDTAPLLAEAQRRDKTMPQELTAVVGKTVSAEWTPVGSISLDDGTYQIACCIRLTPVSASMRSVQTDETMRADGGTWRDEGRVSG